ncbi:hypothetical protein AcW1_008311 [Taiwanofungus camphoratus]|nr:hypothetical protein AcW1_008311 [Antrodia cinnamomea]
MSIGVIGHGRGPTRASSILSRCLPPSPRSSYPIANSKYLVVCNVSSPSPGFHDLESSPSFVYSIWSSSRLSPSDHAQTATAITPREQNDGMGTGRSVQLSSGLSIR